MVKVATSKEERLQLLEKVGETLLNQSYQSWNFGDSTGFEAILVTGKLLNDPKYFAFAHGWFAAWASRPEPFRRLDCTAPGVALIEVAQVTKNKPIFNAGIRADYSLARSDRQVYRRRRRGFLGATFFRFVESCRSRLSGCFSPIGPDRTAQPDDARTDGHSPGIAAGRCAHRPGYR